MKRYLFKKIALQKNQHKFIKMKAIKVDLFRKILMSISLILICSPFFGQTKVVRGVVTIFTDAPVVNAEITSKKTGSKVVSLEDGSFEIVCKNRDVLNIKGVLFENKRVRVRNNTENINVNVQFVDTPENVEIAMGYGAYVDEVNKLYSSSHSENKNGYCQYSNMNDCLRANVPGLDLTKSLPYFNDNATGQYPLIVVDGVNNKVDILNFISPCDVVSIDVVRHEGTSLYGVQAPGGVIILTTRK